MKYRNGFVSNSSSSSFVVLKDALTEDQMDKIFNYQWWIEKLIDEDEIKWVTYSYDNNRLKNRFEYYKSDTWNLKNTEDYIFGETSMDNFSFDQFLDYIKVDQNYVKWDDGYTDEPYPSQLQFIQRMKQKYRKEKIDKLNNL